ncbi:MAG: HD domain-containing protein [Desulfofustis sp.]|nr:HD domain-containing protein [Desulfofustis sp.]
MTAPPDQNRLFDLLAALCDEETRRLSPAAAFSADGLRRRTEERIGYRQHYAQDADRILHSRAYTRYIDKTQVFCLISNDHITHRVLHVQLVSRIARTIGRFLRLNEDLIEAIALGHDIGHPPFGHAGEHFLTTLCRAHGLPPFQHNIQSVRALERLERKGRGWNLTLQTLDGILCHDGEVHAAHLAPEPPSDFASFDAKLNAKSADPAINLLPMTLEACVVRLADTVAYIGRDIEDAIILGLIRRDDIPARPRRLLGETNGSIVYSLVTDLIAHSRVTPPGHTLTPGADFIGFGEPVADALDELKRFNYRSIYLSKQTQRHMPLIDRCYRDLFSYYLQHLENGTADRLDVDLMGDLEDSYTRYQPAAARVRDFIAGMTDDYFLAQAAAIGCPVPQRH